MTFSLRKHKPDAPLAPVVKADVVDSPSGPVYIDVLPEATTTGADHRKEERSVSPPTLHVEPVVDDEPAKKPALVQPIDSIVDGKGGSDVDEGRFHLKNLVLFNLYFIIFLLENYIVFN